MTYRRYCPNCKKWFDTELSEMIDCPHCEKEIHSAKCNRCGYEWSLRFSTYPTTCANIKCKSPYFNSHRVKATMGKIRYVENEEVKA